MSAIEKRIQSTDWYRQGGALTLYYISAVLLSVRNTFTPINFFEGKNAYNYFDKQKEKYIARSIVAQQIKNPGYFIKKYVLPWRKLQKQLAKYYLQATPQHLSSFSEKQLFKFYTAYNQLRVRSWKLSVAIEPFDPWGELLLTDLLRTKDLHIASEDLAILTGQQSLHYLQKEQLQFKKLALANKLGRLTLTMLDKHFANWYWLENSWHHVVYLKIAYFKKRLKAQSVKSSNKLHKEINALRVRQQNLQRSIRQVEKKHNLPKDVAHIFLLFRQLTDWRDERKMGLLKENHAADIFLREFAKRTGLPYETLEFLDAWEATSLERICSLKKDMKKRKRRCLFYYEGNAIHWVYGAGAKRLHMLIQRKLHTSVLKGQVATPGHVRGKVIKIITREDFSKMRKKGIVVTQMTRPEFIPLLKQASAIVTDEGGITCHAAIVSRELGIPCVIGTQNATQLLQDGDTIEVDAYTGAIKKI